MAVQLKKHLITVEEYHLMGQAGILTEKDRVELIRGEIIYMSPIGSRHAFIVDKLITILYPLLKDGMFLRIQNPVQLSDLSEPEPDLVIIEGPMEKFEEQHPKGKDVSLLIEVSDSTLDKDREIKLPLYAESGVPVVWIINLREEEIEVHSNPDRNAYLERRVFRKGMSVSLPYQSEAIEVNRIFK